AGLKAGEIDGDVDVAQLAQARDDVVVAPILPEPRHLVVRDLQPREPLVVTNAELPKAERAHEGLGGVDAPQLLRRDGVAVLEARGQAGERGLIPRRQSERARELADLLLGEPG